ncbi:MAG: hypothetical protein ACF8TS_09350 [Maioricimonas sp. JB049]
MSRWYRWAFVAGAGLIPLFITVLEFVDPAEQRVLPVSRDVALWLHTHRLMVVLMLAAAEVVGGSAGLVLNVLCLFDRRQIHEILESAVQHHFRSQDRASHHYRATLFKIRRFPFCGSWLGIVARSGENYADSGTIFSLDRMRKRYCTGIVGECARQNTQMIVALTDAGSEDDYAMRGYTAECEFQELNVRASVFFATPIVRQDGRTWGVLVLDTTDPGYAPAANQKNRVQSDLSHWALALKTAFRH